MTLRTARGKTRAEDALDVAAWLRGLTGCPSIDRTEVVTCTRDMHGDEPGQWFYVEADAAAGVARMRCLRCGCVREVLDSADRWTYPPTWSCGNCRQSIAEVVFGTHEDGSGITWAAMAVRCVDCGDFAGIADFVAHGVTFDELMREVPL